MRFSPKSFIFHSSTWRWKKKSIILFRFIVHKRLQNYSSSCLYALKKTRLNVKARQVIRRNEQTKKKEKWCIHVFDAFPPGCEHASNIWFVYSKATSIFSLHKDGLVYFKRNDLSIDDLKRKHHEEYVYEISEFVFMSNSEPVYFLGDISSRLVAILRSGRTYYAHLYLIHWEWQR